MTVKNWFENKLSEELNGGCLEAITNIEKETEKAVYAEILWAYCSGCARTIKHWIPKSVLISEEEKVAELDAQADRFESGLEYNKKLVVFAKENGVKGIREGLRTETLINKIKNAGLAVPARA